MRVRRITWIARTQSTWAPSSPSTGQTGPAGCIGAARVREADDAAAADAVRHGLRQRRGTRVQRWAIAERSGTQGNKKPPHRHLVGVLRRVHPGRSSCREEVFVKAIEAGLLTDGSSYLPTPSQQRACQWPVLLAFVPDHSGAPVREWHPLPVSSTSIARIANGYRDLS
jgi:hypothetical protein